MSKRILKNDVQEGLTINQAVYEHHPQNYELFVKIELYFQS